MRQLLTNLNIYRNGCFMRGDILIINGMIVKIAPRIKAKVGTEVLDLNGKFAFPGLVDVHVHLREPGYSYKENIGTGTAAAAKGGYTDICSMPNVAPIPDDAEHLQEQLERIRESAVVNVHPYGSVNRGENCDALSDMEAMSNDVIAFSNDGVPVKSLEVMRAAMMKAKRLGKLVASHCEDGILSNGGCMHDGEFAKTLGLKGISSESEWSMLEKELQLVRETGCAFHVCHVSCKESVELIRQAKAEGLDVTCETAPHYLLLDDSMIEDDGRFKMNPPIRAAADREALIAGLLDGTIDMIATDHAPHSEDEKSQGMEGSAFGVVGLETAFPILYTQLVQTGTLSLCRLIELMSVNPRKRFGFRQVLEVGTVADLAIYDLGDCYQIDPMEFVSLGRSTPFENVQVYGYCLLTLVQGNIAWADKKMLFKECRISA